MFDITRGYSMIWFRNNFTGIPDSKIQIWTAALAGHDLYNYTMHLLFGKTLLENEPGNGGIVYTWKNPPGNRIVQTFQVCWNSFTPLQGARLLRRWFFLRADAKVRAWHRDFGFYGWPSWENVFVTWFLVVCIELEPILPFLWCEKMMGVDRLAVVELPACNICIMAMSKNSSYPNRVKLRRTVDPIKVKPAKSPWTQQQDPGLSCEKTNPRNSVFGLMLACKGSQSVIFS